MTMAGLSGGFSSVSDAAFESAIDCYVCDKKFYAFRRKHRCRSCGNAVCGSCARTHKIMPSSAGTRYSNEPVRVCDCCVRDQNRMMLERRRAEDVNRARARQVAALEEAGRQREAERSQREREVALAQARRELRLRALEEKHLGPRPDVRTLRSRSLRSRDDWARDDGPQSLHSKELGSFLKDAEKRSVALVAEPCGISDGFVEDKQNLLEGGCETLETTTVVQEAEECAICLETMDVGNAIYTTACGHSFHWSCLKEIQNSDSSNYDKCPSCRATMTEMQVKKQCDHPRVRLGHRFCRDCGAAATERDAKPRVDDTAAMGRPSLPMPSAANPPELNQPVSYRASPHGALVRCPQCHIQMRVLPHMYNMRVACLAGHMFLVQVSSQPGGTGGGRGSYGLGGSGGPRMPMRGASTGFPGSYYHSTHNYSEL
uniref:RING-type domain-containing protein n=1 Tax=Hyaloperonospora arabidopsidis (strain Emoy2) TaxID=559515 RepID=M4BGL6_HYAAE